MKGSTAALIADYDRRMASRTRYISCNGNDISRQQKMINRIVDELSARADAGDADALAWFEH